MKITMYELLGLIKEGKAPYKFIIDDAEYRWDYEDHKYYRKAGFDEYGQKYYELFEDDYNLYFCLNHEVEIIEEPKKIEKINRNRYPGTDIDPLYDILDKLDELIDVVNELKRDK